MTQPRNTPNPGTSSKPGRSSKKVASKRHLGILPLLLALLLALIIAGVVLAIVLANHSDNKHKTSSPAPVPVATAPVAPTTDPTVAPTDTSSTGTATGSAAALEANSMNLVGLPAAQLKALDGQAATGTGTVQSVVSDEGFWVGTSTSDRVFVYLSAAAKKGQTESPYTVKQGDLISLDGTVRPLSPTADAGVTAAEGLTQLKTQGTYVEATRVQLAS